MEIIIDINGRVGVVTERRETGVFARPAGVPYEVESSSLVGMRGKLITTTFWARGADGAYQGLWYDSGCGDFVTAHDLDADKLRPLNIPVTVDTLAALVSEISAPCYTSAHKGVDWSSVDWSNTNTELARSLGVSPQAVGAARKRHQG